LEEELVDDAANGLIAHPESYDALPAPNLFGDILSDEAAALAGSLAASANPGEGAAVFLPVRHGPCYNALAAAWRSVRPPTGPASATPWRGGRSAP
jgi:isocitrate/isopropylmalate dehydrogenase